MARKMTVPQLESARDAAARMFRNFGDEDRAAEFEGMTPESYAEHKGIEIIEANPTGRTRRERKTQQPKPTRGVKSMSTIFHTNAETGEEVEVEISSLSKAELEDACEDLAEKDVKAGDAAHRIADAVEDFENGKIDGQELADEVWAALSEYDPEEFEPEDEDEQVAA